MENPWIPFAKCMPPKGIEILIKDDKENVFSLHRCNCDDPSCSEFDGRSGDYAVNGVYWKYDEELFEGVNVLSINDAHLDKFVESLLIDCFSKNNNFNYSQIKFVDKDFHPIDKEEICSRFESMYYRRLSASELNTENFLIPIIDRYFQVNLGMKRQTEIIQVYSQAETKMIESIKKISDAYLEEIVADIRIVSELEYNRQVEMYQARIKGYLHILSKIFPKYQIKISYSPIND